MKNNKKYMGMFLFLSVIFLTSLNAATTVNCPCVNANTGATEGTVDLDVCKNKACTQAQKDEDIKGAHPNACVQSKGGSAQSYTAVNPTDCK